MMLRISNKIIPLAIIMLFGLNVVAQSNEDIQLVSNHQSLSKLPDHSYNKDDKKTKFINAINPLYWVYKGGIGFYQGHISSQLSTSCIYEISCSRFSKKLFNEYGLLKAITLSADRIGRCNRMTHTQVSRLRLTNEGKVIESVGDYSFRK